MVTLRKRMTVPMEASGINKIVRFLVLVLYYLLYIYEEQQVTIIISII